MSDRMREVLADQFCGFSFTESCEKNGTTVNAFSNLTRRNQDAWQLCQQEIKEAVLTNIGTNAWILRSVLSDIGPHAARTLYDLMEDRSINPNVRRQAATDVLKLLDVSGAAHIGAKLEETAARFADLTEVMADQKEGDYVISVEAEEEC